MKAIIQHIVEDSLKNLINKANRLGIKPSEYLQIFQDKGSYYLIFKGYEK